MGVLANSSSFQGAQKISPFPSVEDLISRLLHLICDQNDKERAFVKFSKNDDTVLLINNYGGLSNLELGALTHETLGQLEKNWDIRPTKIYSGAFETSLNGPGFSITLCNLTNAAKESGASVDELMDLLGAETKAPAWPNVAANSSTKGNRKRAPGIDIEKRTKVEEDEDISIDPKLLAASVRLACQRAIDAEPELTKWDMEMGDGDCGEAVKGVSEAILRILDEGVANSGSIFAMLYAIIEAVDDMGGTLGGILGILLAALASSLRNKRAEWGKGSDLMDIFAPALAQAVDTLKNYTGAREGDRTVMDVLIPLAGELDSTRNFGKAVKKVDSAADGTKDLRPAFGRASYVAVTGSEKQRVPDPGAWALMVWVKGLYDGSQGEK
jgi:dihydroxyacetone kinase